MTRNRIAVHRTTTANKSRGGEPPQPISTQQATCFSAVAAKEFNDAVAAADALFGECRNALYRQVLGAGTAELKRRDPRAKTALAALSPQERAVVDIALFYSGRAIMAQRLRGRSQCATAIKMVAGRIGTVVRDLTALSAASEKPANDTDQGSSVA